MPAENIWEAAIAYQKVKLEEKGGNNINETTLLFVGSKNVGKTTLIHRLLERQEAPKPTLALEYTFGRKKNQNLGIQMTSYGRPGLGSH